MSFLAADLKIIFHGFIFLLLSIYLGLLPTTHSTESKIQSSDNATYGSITFLNQGNLTKAQEDVVITIEFNFTKMNETDKNFLEKVYHKKVQKVILDYLNRKNISTESTTTTATSTTVVPSTTTVVPTTTTVVPTTTTVVIVVAATTTPAAPLDVATSTPCPPTEECIVNRRRRRHTGGDERRYTEENLPFVDLQTPVKDETLRMPLLIEKQDTESPQKTLKDAALHLNASGDLYQASGLPVVRIYEGLPDAEPKSSEVSSPVALADFRVWLPILLVIFFLILIFIFICCWKKTKKTVHEGEQPDDDRKPIEPIRKAEPSKNSNQMAPRRSPNGHGRAILDDNCGWIVPYDQFQDDVQDYSPTVVMEMKNV